ncbi:Slp family lipoprotein [Dokdonella sp.]|uniref:Slp family lipoprotein n=1 Tax=Dokdonella sp. TaxID=2291710 RepID=UPI003C3FB3DD
MQRFLFLCCITAMLGACVTVPVPLKGQFSEVNPSQVADSGQAGESVRWGGEIIKVTPGESATCFELLSRQLDAKARPRPSDSSDGRFIACRAGFYDPEVFVKGRDLTITGKVEGTEKGLVGKFDYTYPRVAADTIYLWPKRPLIIQTDDPWPYAPYWGGFGPYWGAGFWGPW